MIIVRRHPCKKDCPDRTAECKSTCEAWKEYEAEKMASYKEIETMRRILAPSERQQRHIDYLARRKASLKRRR